MKLAELAREPQLEKVVINSESITEHYGEPIEFYMYDTQDMSTFMKLATINQDNTDELMQLISKLVLTEEGNPILTDSTTVPIPVLTAVIETVVSRLGNLQNLATKT